MKGLLVVLVLIAACIVGFGFYRGWFNVSTDNTEQKSNVTFTVDKDKIQDDKEKAKEKMQDLGHKAREKAGDLSDKVKEPTDTIKEPERRP